MGYDLDNLPLWAPSPIGSHHPYLHPVAVHDTGHFPLGEKNILACIIRNDKAKAIAMALNGSEAIGFARYQDFGFTHGAHSYNQDSNGYRLIWPLAL